MDGVTLVRHPLVQAKLAELRDHRTPSPEFRRLLRECAGWLFYEAARDVTTRRETVTTPLARAPACRLRRPLLLVPVLRAGLGMLDGILPLMPGATVGFIGLQRNEATLVPEAYYHRLPPRPAGFEVFLLDPMLATGGSTTAALDTLRTHGARRIRLVCLVAAPAGLRRVRQRHPDVPITTAAVDRRLDRRGFILPGLGDAGDRLFGN